MSGQRNKVETSGIRGEPTPFATGSPTFYTSLILRSGVPHPFPRDDCGLVSPFMSPLGLPLLPPTLAQMTPPSAAIDAIFSRPRDAAAILFLVEDSTQMVPLWQRLREAYLPSLLAAVKTANPSVPVSPCASVPPLLLIAALQAETLWMSASERAPFQPFDLSTRRTPRWDEIPPINFSPHGGNTISPANVTRAVEVRQCRPIVYDLTPCFSLGVVSDLWPRARNAPSRHCRVAEPHRGHAGSPWKSRLVYHSRTTVSSV